MLNVQEMLLEWKKEKISRTVSKIAICELGILIDRKVWKKLVFLDIKVLRLI